MSNQEQECQCSPCMDSEAFAAMMQQMMANCPCADLMKQMTEQGKDMSGCMEMMAKMMAGQTNHVGPTPETT